MIQGVQFALTVLTRVGEWSLDKLGMISPPQSPFGGFRGRKEIAIHHLAQVGYNE